MPAELKHNLEATHTNEFNLAKVRLSKQMKQPLESVPEHRPTIAEERITRRMQLSFQEAEKLERIEALDSSSTTALRSATMPTRRASLVLSEGVASCKYSLLPS